MKIQLPENIDLSHPERYILTIRLHPQSFSFSLYNPVDNSSYFYHTITGNEQYSAFLNFKDAFFENDFFALTFRKVFIINYSKTFTYIPSLIFEEKDSPEYMRLLFSEKTETLLSQSLHNPKLTIVHELPNEVYEFMHRSFIDARFIHHTASLIVYFNERVRLVNANRMIINLQKNEMDILCFSRNHLLLGNHFECPTIENAIYYVLFIWKQWKFDQLTDFIYIAGDPDSKKALMDGIKTYVHNIIPVNITPEAHFEQVDTRIIPFEMASLSLCEL